MKIGQQYKPGSIIANPHDLIVEHEIERKSHSSSCNVFFMARVVELGVEGRSPSAGASRVAM